MALKQSSGLLAFAAMATGIHALEPVSQVLAYVVGIGCFFIFAQHRRALHDLAAGTAVYHNTDVIAR
jgi:uncharacterized RDD family membrane protein YckC